MVEIKIKKCLCGCGKDVYGRKRYLTECVAKRKKEQRNKYAKKKVSKKLGNTDTTIKPDANGNYICCGKKMIRVSNSSVIDCELCDNCFFVYQEKKGDRSDI